MGGGRDRSILIWATDFQGFKAKLETKKLKVKDFAKEKGELSMELVDTTMSSKQSAKEDRKKSD